MQTPKNPKSFSEEKKPPTTKPCSEKVHFLKSDAYKYMSGERKPTGIRVDSGLYKRFKQVSKASFGSTCRAIEICMIAIIETAEKGVHFGNTVNQPIQIEKIVIERNLRTRRSLPFQDFEITRNEPVKIERSKRPVIESDLPDYSKFSTEKLKMKHRAAWNLGKVGKSALIFAELKKRGQEAS